VLKKWRFEAKPPQPQRRIQNAKQEKWQQQQREPKKPPPPQGERFCGRAANAASRRLHFVSGMVMTD
jgi:hypothetical protein